MGVLGCRVAMGVIVPQGFAYCCLSLQYKNKADRVRLHCSLLRLLFWRLTIFWQVAQSIIGIIWRIKFAGGQGHSHLTKKRSVKALALMFWKLSFMTSLWPCLWSTTLACLQWTYSPPPPFFFFSPAFSHTHTQLREKMTSLQLSIHCTSIGLNGPAQQKVT